MKTFKQFKQQLDEKLNLFPFAKNSPSLRPNQMELAKKIIQKAKSMQDREKAGAWANLQIDTYKRSHPEISSKEIEGMKERVRLGLS